MKSLRILIAAAAIAAVVIPGSPAAAADRSRHVVAGQTDSWTTIVATGANTSHLVDEDDSLNPEACGKTVYNYCDHTLLTLANPVPSDDGDGLLRRTVTIALSATAPATAGDFDLKIYNSDASGKKGDLAAEFSQAAPPNSLESYVFEVQTSRGEPSKHFLLEVIYFASANSAARTTVTF